MLGLHLSRSLSKVPAQLDAKDKARGNLGIVDALFVQCTSLPKLACIETTMRLRENDVSHFSLQAVCRTTEQDSRSVVSRST